jgi:eukaryotic-like serine/threonine-protein kinase
VTTEPATDSVRLGKTFEILPGQPAGEFRTSGAEAYAARDRDRPGEPLFALICAPQLPPRIGLLDPLVALNPSGLLTPRAWGVVDWPPRQRRCYAIIFSQPQSRLVGDLYLPFPALSEDEIVFQVLPPIMAALKLMHESGLTHRAVRPTNLFRAESGGIVLGECVSAPPALAQPVVFEPIESGLAAPAGRGAGLPADDLYALGVTLVALFLGRDPALGQDDKAVLAEKIGRGSFITLLGEARPARIVEVLRGLLADDARERWTVQDLDAWLQNRHIAGRQSNAQAKRAGRPFELGGEAHFTARAVADGYARDPAAAAALIRSGALDAWLKRSLSDPERAAIVAKVQREGGEGNDTRLVARVTMALDPAAPVRYLSLAAHPDGFGPLLAETFAADGNGAVISEAIMARLPHLWIGLQGPLRPEQVHLLKSFDRMRLLLEDRRFGFGLARVAYELNPGLPCLSPAVEAEHVMEPALLLPALERAAAEGRAGDPLFDRQLAAFIGARCKGLATDWCDELASSNPPMRTLGALRLLAHLQTLQPHHAMPALRARVGKDLPNLIARFRSKTRRARLLAMLSRLIERGSLAEIVALVAGRAEREKDDAEFRAAREEFARVEREKAALRAEEAERPRLAAELGGQIAAATSGALAVAAALATILLRG